MMSTMNNKSSQEETTTAATLTVAETAILVDNNKTTMVEAEFKTTVEAELTDILMKEANNEKADVPEQEVVMAADETGKLDEKLTVEAQLTNILMQEAAAYVEDFDSSNKIAHLALDQ